MHPARLLTTDYTDLSAAIRKLICVICGYCFPLPKFGGLTSDGATAAPKASKSTPGLLPSLPFPLTLLCGPRRQSPFATSTKPTSSSEFTTKFPLGTLAGYPLAEICVLLSTMTLPREYGDSMFVGQ